MTAATTQGERLIAVAVVQVRERGGRDKRGGEARGGEVTCEDEI